MAALTVAHELRMAVVSAAPGVDFDRYPGDRSFGRRRRLVEVWRKLDGSRQLLLALAERQVPPIVTPDGWAAS